MARRAKQNTEQTETPPETPAVPEKSGEEMVRTAIKDRKDGVELAPEPEKEVESPVEQQAEIPEVTLPSEDDKKREADLATARLRAEEYRKREVARAEEEIKKQVSETVDDKEPTEEELIRVIEEGSAAERVKATRQLAKIEARKLLNDSRSRDEINQKQLDFERRRANANAKVYATHPEMYVLDHPQNEQERVQALQTPFVQAYQKVLSERPHLKDYPDGAELAMKLAEDELGATPSTAKTPAQQQMNDLRTGRASAAAGMGGGAQTVTPPMRNVQPLDENQREAADRLQLTEEEYRAGILRQTPMTRDYYKTIRANHASKFKKKFV